MCSSFGPFIYLEKMIHTQLIYERQDRTMIRKDWSILYPNVYETQGNFSCSDHCAIIMSTQTHLSKVNAFPFRFQNF